MRSAVDVHVVVGVRRLVGVDASFGITVLALSMSAAVITLKWTPLVKAHCATDLVEELHRLALSWHPVFRR
jgi:hypothetical protein